MWHKHATAAATGSVFLSCQHERPVNWAPAPPLQGQVSTGTWKPWRFPAHTLVPRLIFGSVGTIKVPRDKGGNPYPYPLFSVVSTFLLDPSLSSHQLLRTTTLRRQVQRFHIINTTRLYKFDTMAVFGSFRKWLALKQYQLEVTFSVYMFTPWEKFFFSTKPLLFCFSLNFTL
jgi:hypothetical protein